MKRIKHKSQPKRKYPFSAFPTDKMADEFFEKYPTSMERFEAVLRRITDIRLENNPCPFKDCPNEKMIAQDNIVQFEGVRLDSQPCLERYKDLRNSHPYKWCYFDENGASHHVYPFTATSKKGINLCYCGYKEQIYDKGSKGWIFRYRDEKGNDLPEVTA